MASLRLVLIIAVSFLLALINPGLAWKENGVIHVSGRVMCQDCTKPYYQWVQGDRPIKGCKVSSLTYMDDRRRVTHYDSDETDEQGYFNIMVGKYLNNGKQLIEKLCLVRLVSSPDPTCNVLTNFGFGKSGIKLQQATSVYRESTRYMVGTFYCTSPVCEQPNTGGPQEAGFPGKIH